MQDSLSSMHVQVEKKGYTYKIVCIAYLWKDMGETGNIGCL